MQTLEYKVVRGSILSILCKFVVQAVLGSTLRNLCSANWEVHFASFVVQSALHRLWSSTGKCLCNLCSTNSAGKYFVQVL